jgi:hypothetical protein
MHPSTMRMSHVKQINTNKAAAHQCTKNNESKLNTVPMQLYKQHMLHSAEEPARYGAAVIQLPNYLAGTPAPCG